MDELYLSKLEARIAIWKQVLQVGVRVKLAAIPADEHGEAIPEERGVIEDLSQIDECVVTVRIDERYRSAHDTGLRDWPLEIIQIEQQS